MSGFQGWVINLVLNRFYKKIWLGKWWPEIKASYNKALQKIRDDAAGDKLADTISQGKDSDSDQEVKDQLDILNPKP